VTVGRRGLGVLLVATFLLAGCAQPARLGGQPGAQVKAWNGRISIQIESEPPQSFSAGFELTGDTRAGELALFSPLGATLAKLQWQPGTATLRDSQNRIQTFDSLDALATRALATPVPVAALFDWLHGTNTSAAGWQADLARLDAGRITAKRIDPAPPAQLRLILDR
jgi:outer membrane lipoprotein LolB